MKFEMWGRFGNEILFYKMKLWFIDKKMKLWYNKYSEKYIVIFLVEFFTPIYKGPEHPTKKIPPFLLPFLNREKEKSGTFLL